MPTLPDAHLDDPPLNDAFDFSRYPIFKTRNARPPNVSSEQRHRVRGRITLFAYSSRGSPTKAPRSRNVSEPQLVSSTNYMRESWFANPASARTVGDIADLSGDGHEILPAVHLSQSPTTTRETPGDGHVDQKAASERDDSSDIPGLVEPTECNDEDNSFYSMDSADQDAHPLLLSMPVIPQIKLERKATLRKRDSGSSSDATQNQALLSPRIADLRTPTRMSSRRYGRILRTSPQAAISDGTISRTYVHDTPSSGTSRRPGTKMTSMRSVSEPVLKHAYPSDDEEEPLLKQGTDESPHSDVLLSMIDEANSGTNGDHAGFAIDKLLRHKHSKCSHRRSSLSHSISFSRIVHAVADGCASFDLLLRKSITKVKPHGRVPDVHDPTSKWAPKQGQIIIKVFVPSTDDIWTFRVPQEINLADFTSRVANKLGFPVSFSGSLWDEPKYYFTTDERFKWWVKGRVRFGRNLPLVAHIPAPPPLVRLSVDDDGCEVWCYAS